MKKIFSVSFFFIVSFFCFCFHSYKVSADATYIPLTPYQTLALYGTSIPGIIYPNNNSQPVTVSFDYSFTLRSVGYMDNGGGFDIAQMTSAMAGYTGTSEISSYLGGSGGVEGLVYVASSSQWGGSALVPYDKSQNFPVQLHMPFSVNISNNDPNDPGIIGLRQAVLYSSVDGFSARYPIRPYNTNNSITWLFSDSNLSLRTVPGLTNAGVGMPAHFELPTYPYYSSQGALDESQVQFFNCFYINTEEQPDPFGYSGFTIDCYMVTNCSTTSNDIWLILTCPTIWGYTPPPVTSTTAQSTIATATFPTATFPTSTTYDPLKIINDNSNTIISQLNTIIGQLNAIYNRMVSQGQIPVDLIPADQLHTLPTDVQTQLHQAIQGFTTSRLPDSGNGYQFFGSLYSFFTTDTLSFFGIFGGFSLAFSVVCWFIFRGRH